MSAIEHQLNQFNAFAQAALSAGGDQLTLDELWDRWRLENPTAEESREDLLAVKAALRDMEAGDHGRPADEIIRELRERYNLPAQS